MTFQRDPHHWSAVPHLHLLRQAELFRGSTTPAHGIFHDRRQNHLASMTYQWSAGRFHASARRMTDVWVYKRVNRVLTSAGLIDLMERRLVQSWTTWVEIASLIAVVMIMLDL